MATCPNCGASVPESAIACGRCGTALDAQRSTASSFQSQPSSSPQRTQDSVPLDTGPGKSDLSMRLEKALRRSELLSYAAIGIGLAILIIIVIA